MINVSKKQMFYLTAAIVIGLILAWLLLGKESISVETATSRRGPMTVTVEAEGKTRARVKITVSAPISGKMSRIKLAEGDYIPHDYPITEIDPNPPLQRTPDKRDDLPNIYAARVFAPIAGRVLRIIQKSQGFVTAGTPLIEIGDPDNIEIVVDVLSTDAVKIPPGAPILVVNESSTEPLKARVHLIEPQATTKVSALGVEEQRVNVIGKFLSEAPKFGDNYRVDVSIIVWESEDVLTIPSSALFRAGDKWNVYVVEAGSARLRTVKAGRQNAENTQVVDGISEGEIVILHPPSQLVDGAKVSTR